MKRAVTVCLTFALIILASNVFMAVPRLQTYIVNSTYYNRIGTPGIGAGLKYAENEGKTLKAARDEVERDLITGGLLRLKGNVSAAAQELDISRPTLHDLMKKFEIDPNTFRPRKNRKR